MKPGQIQFLKKIRDRPLTREDLNYYKGHQYYQELVDGDLEAFICLIEQDGYVERAEQVPEVWTCTDKGREAAERLIAEARSNPSCLHAELAELNADESLKVATELKRDGNLDGAIEALKISYKKISESSTTYRSETFLRLPNYLILAGRFDEAWESLNKLISGATNLRDRSNIYSAMGSALHKEGKHAQAIALDALSLMAWAHFWHTQAEDVNFFPEIETRKEFRETFTKVSQREYIASGLKQSIPKKAGKIDLGEAVNYVYQALKVPAEIKYDIAYIEIDRILHRQISDRGAADQGNRPTNTH